MFQAGQTLSARHGRIFSRTNRSRCRVVDGARQFGWVMRSGGSDEGTWVLFLHGNAATIAAKREHRALQRAQESRRERTGPDITASRGSIGVPTESCSPPMRARPTTISAEVRQVSTGRTSSYTAGRSGSAVAVGLAARR